MEVLQSLQRDYLTFADNGYNLSPDKENLRLISSVNTIQDKFNSVIQRNYGSLTRDSLYNFKNSGFKHFVSAAEDYYNNTSGFKPYGKYQERVYKKKKAHIIKTPPIYTRSSQSRYIDDEDSVKLLKKPSSLQSKQRKAKKDKNQDDDGIKGKKYNSTLLKYNDDSKIGDWNRLNSYQLSLSAPRSFFYQPIEKNFYLVTNLPRILSLFSQEFLKLDQNIDFGTFAKARDRFINSYLTAKHDRYKQTVYRPTIKHMLAKLYDRKMQLLRHDTFTFSAANILGQNYSSSLWVSLLEFLFNDSLRQYNSYYFNNPITHSLLFSFFNYTKRSSFKLLFLRYKDEVMISKFLVQKRTLSRTNRDRALYQLLYDFLQLSVFDFSSLKVKPPKILWFPSIKNKQFRNTKALLTPYLFNRNKSNQSVLGDAFTLPTQLDPFYNKTSTGDVFIRGLVKEFLIKFSKYDISQSADVRRNLYKIFNTLKNVRIMHTTFSNLNRDIKNILEMAYPISKRLPTAKINLLTFLNSSNSVDSLNFYISLPYKIRQIIKFEDFLKLILANKTFRNITKLGDFAVFQKLTGI